MSRIGRLARATVALVSAFVSVARNTNPLVLFGAHRWGCERGGIGRGWRRVVIREAGLRPRLTQFRPMGWKSAAHQTARLSLHSFVKIRPERMGAPGGVRKTDPPPTEVAS